MLAIYFVGMDLAWGEVNPTGLCALDENGRVLESTSLYTDSQIKQWLNQFLDSDCLVAVDAPLIVPADIVRRDCDNLVSKVFGSREGSTHTANRNQPAFRDGGRASRLAKSLGMSIEPELSSAFAGCRMIEVYPHTAILCLFQLGKTLKYKNKSGRSVGSRKHEFDVLIRHLETLEKATPKIYLSRSDHWAKLRSRLSQAGTHAALNEAEDELDAYVCAYVALFYWVHRNNANRWVIFGDRERGYIVSPVDANALEAHARHDTLLQRGLNRHPESRFRRRSRNEFTAIIEKDGAHYIAYCPEITGANGQGRSIEECKKSLAAAISLIMKQRKEEALRGAPSHVLCEVIAVE